MSVNPIRIALYGQFGVRSLGNDASLAAMLQILRRQAPEAVVECICEDPSDVQRQFGISGVAMRWHKSTASRWSVLDHLVELFGTKLVDPLRTYRIVGNYDVVIVPGTGVFEGLGRGTWGRPYGLVLLTLAVRLRRRRLAFVSVGAEPVDRRSLAGRFTRATVRWADYLSYRDEYSRRAHADLAPRVATAPVFVDLTFGLTGLPGAVPRQRQTVYVGVMRYLGIADDADSGAGRLAGYVVQMTEFVSWLAQADYDVVVGIGDRADVATAQEVAARAVADLPPDAAARVRVELPGTYGELAAILRGTDLVVGTRFHNVVFGLLLGKPTLAIGYAQKTAEVMDRCGQGRFYQHVDSLDVPLLLKQFEALQASESDVAEQVGGAATRLRNLLAEQEPNVVRDLT